MEMSQLMDNSKQQFYVQNGIITGSKPLEVYIGYFETEAEIIKGEWIPYEEMSEEEKRGNLIAKNEGGYNKRLSKPIIKFQNVYREERRYAKNEKEAKKIMKELTKEIEKRLAKKDERVISKVADTLILEAYGGYVPAEKRDEQYEAKKEHFKEEAKKSITSEIYKSFIGDVKDLVIDTRETMIGKGAFRGRGLRSVTFGDNISIIARDAFADNEIESVKLPENLGVIGERAFAGNHISSISIPENVTSIRAEAFKNNEIEKVEFAPESELTYIGSETFAGNKITEIEFPKRLSRLYEDSFDEGVKLDNSGVFVAGGRQR